MILYKFLSPDRIDVLAKSKIRFSQLSAFNDPFDMKLDWTQFEVLSQIEGKSEEELKQLVGVLIDQSETELLENFVEYCIENKLGENYLIAAKTTKRQEFRNKAITDLLSTTMHVVKLFMNDSCLNEILNEIDESNSSAQEIAKSVPDFSNQPSDVKKAVIDRVNAKIEEHYLEYLFIEMSKSAFVRKVSSEIVDDTLDGIIGTLCLSEDPNSLLMWSHYAQNHTGFAIGFDSEDPYFKLAEIPIKKVRYLGNITPINFENQMQKQKEFLDFCFQKAECWSYEKEWRFIKPLVEHDERIDTTPPIFLFNLPVHAVKQIVIGVGAEGKFKAKVIQICKEQYPKAQIYYAKKRGHDFKLHLIEADFC